MAQTGVILQGGGALGAYEYGALRRLYEEPDFRPDFVSGVSIGAITAATLVGAKGDPIETLGALWQDFTIPASPFVPETVQRFLSLFGNLSFFRMRTDYLNGASWTSFYDTAPLRATLEEFIDFEKIRNSPTKLFVTATNVSTGRVEVFENRSITPEHVLASGALPPGFPMIEIAYNSYWDGGVFDNSPLSPVIEAMDPDSGVGREIIVMNLFPGHGAIPGNMMEVLDRAFEITFSNKFQATVKQTGRVNEYIEVVEAIDRALPPDHPVRKLPGYARLKQYTYINDIIFIENTSPEVVSAPFDFSQKAIQARIHAGYRDAEAALRERPARALPEGLLRSP